MHFNKSVRAITKGLRLHSRLKNYLGRPDVVKGFKGYFRLLYVASHPDNYEYEAHLSASGRVCVCPGHAGHT